MPLEIEAKLRVESLDPVRERLRAAGAELLGCVLEANRIFDRPDGSLRRGGCGLRVRSCVAESGDAPPATLTFKGPIVPGAFKSRDEVEVSVGDADVAVRILEALGFVVILAYRKRRESWRLRDCRVELDEPPHIGLFVEIEGPDDAAIHVPVATTNSA